MLFIEDFENAYGPIDCNFESFDNWQFVKKIQLKNAFSQILVTFEGILIFSIVEYANANLSIDSNSESRGKLIDLMKIEFLNELLLILWIRYSFDLKKIDLGIKILSDLLFEYLIPHVFLFSFRTNEILFCIIAFVW